MTTVFVVRHAQSAANLAAYLSSARPGAELTSLGHHQARITAEQLRDQDVRRIVTSPLLRARTTADVLGSALAAQVDVDEALREFDLGDWEGRPGTDQDVVGHPVFAGWMLGRRLAERFQGGDSALDMRKRFMTVLDGVISRPGSTVLVTHGGVMAVAVPLVATSDGEARLPRNAEIWQLLHDGDGWRLGGDGTPGPWRPAETVSDG